MVNILSCGKRNNWQTPCRNPGFLWSGGEHLADQLGWQDAEKKEARSLISKEICEYFICTLGLNISFYFPENDTFYGLHTEEIPYTLYKLPRNRKLSPYIGLQCNGDTHEYGEVVFESNNRENLCVKIRINGYSLEYVLNHSYKIKLN